MSDFVVVIAPAAERDIADAFLWYRERNTLVADGFRAEVVGVVERISARPLSTPANANGNRYRVLKRFPYSVFYEVTGNIVTILAVAHHRRRPDYWHKRRP